MNIPDPNFRLTLLQSLWTAGVKRPIDKQGLYAMLGESYDFAAPYNDAPDTRVREALLNVPISEDELAQLSLVHWDGGDDIHHLIWTSWDGEDSYFDVADLRGIEACVALRRIDFTSGLATTDLAPLDPLRQLEELSLCGRPFEELSWFVGRRVRLLRLFFVDGETNRGVLETLAADGTDTTGCTPRIVGSCRWGSGARGDH